VGHLLVPSLAKVLRSSRLPTTLRTPSSLLAQMVEANALALFPYAADLFGGMVDLLQLESVQATSPSKTATKPSEPDRTAKRMEKVLRMQRRRTVAEEMSKAK